MSSTRLNHLSRRFAKMAEVLSVHSDNPGLIVKTPKGSIIQCTFDMLALCWILPYSSIDTRESEVRAQYANFAAAFPDGEYSNLLFRVATLKQWNLNNIVREIVNEIGTEAFFGILTQYLRSKRLDGFKLIKQRAHEWTPERSVRRGQRKRGYTDKGTLPDHKQISRRIIRQEEAKEEKPSLERPHFDFIKPRRWKSFRR